MGSNKIHQVVILGSGNVATRLSIALKHKGLKILQVYSRNLSHAKLLANQIGSTFTNDLNSISLLADLYILCVSDDALTEIINDFPDKNLFLVHTSGSTSIDIFKGPYANFGVFYPLQTFSKDKEIAFENIPICIEANNKTNEAKLVALANSISGGLELINSNQRKTLHVAAVFASNFTNYFYLISKEILEEQNLSFDLLKPLIAESASKIIDLDPKDAQTGPGKRGDNQIISEHLAFLDQYPEYKKIYELISTHIKQKYSNNDKL